MQDVSRRVMELFVNDPLAQFVQKLRAFSQKFGLPLAGLQFSQASPEDPIVRKIYLPVSQLMEWDGWNAQALRYLESVGDRVFVVEAIEEYEKRVAEFYGWFEDHFRALYSEELADVSRREWELVTLELSSSVSMELQMRSQEQSAKRLHTKRDDVFAQVFSSEQFAEIEGLPDGVNRGERAIATLESMGDVPEELKEAIRTLYRM